MNKDNKNINVLRRLDPSILEIKDTYSHVVVYQLIDFKWRKKGIEGSGFLVLNSDFSLSLFVMNRLGIENHQMPFSGIEKLEILSDFVFYSNNSGIYGIWIYDTKDRERFNNSLTLNSGMSQLTDLWDFIDPHKDKLDYVNFCHRMQNQATLEKLYFSYRSSRNV